MTDQKDMRALLKAVRRIARAFDIQSRRIDRAMGLTLPQYVVLCCLSDLGEVTSRAVSTEADLSAPTVVGILDKLEAKGLVERYRSTRDRRIVHARLTERGQELLAAAPEPLGDAFSERFCALDQAERDAILASLSRLGALFSDAEGGDPARDGGDRTESMDETWQAPRG